MVGSKPTETSLLLALSFAIHAVVLITNRVETGNA
jgi:hypothetical protein